MKSKFAVFITLLLLSGCGSPSSTDLTATDFQGKTMENGVVILDVRTSGEFNSGHIKNAINIEPQLPDHLKELMVSKEYFKVIDDDTNFIKNYLKQKMRR